MENILLQPLLQAGLLEIGDSDERLQHIETSIGELTEKLVKEQNLLPSYMRCTNLSGQSKLLKFDNNDWKEFQKDTPQV
jgi:hypothetical protein